MHTINVEVIEDIYTIYFDEKKYGVFQSIEELNRALSDLFSRLNYDGREW